MADYYLVEQARGPACDDSRRWREQADWDQHAAFMDALTDEGVIVLGGPIGEDDGDNTLLIMDLPSEAAVRDRLAGDPWRDTILEIVSVRPWRVWLRAKVQP